MNHRRETLFVFLVLTAVSLPGLASAADSPEPLSAAEYYVLYNEVMAISSRDELYARIGDVERLVAVDPDNRRALGLLAFAYAGTGETQKAIDTYLEVRRTGAFNNNDTALRLSRLYAETGNRQAALEWVDTALKERISLERVRNEAAFERFADDSAFRSRLGLPDTSVSGRDAEWRFDLELLRREAHRTRFGYDEPAVPDSFDARIDELIARIGELSNDEIWLEARRIVAAITDGHTYIGGPEGETQREFELRTLPVSFFDFDDGLFIVDATPEFRELVGARILDLGGFDRDELVARLDLYSQADNVRTVRYIGVQLALRYTAFLRAIGACDASGEVAARVRLPDGEAQAVSLPSGYFDVGRKLTPPPHLKELPQYLRRVSDAYWMAPMETGVRYVQINSFRNAAEGPSMAEFADLLWSELDGAHFVVVDVRHNNGGNANLSVPLMKTLLAFERAAPENRVFIITGHMSFSATQIFISRLDAFGSPIFVGTPSASSPNFTGEEEPFVLPFSKLGVSFSALHWQNSVPVDHREWIEMDVPVPWTGADYIAGTDAALEAINQIVSRR